MGDQDMCLDVKIKQEFDNIDCYDPSMLEQLGNGEDDDDAYQDLYENNDKHGDVKQEVTWPDAGRAKSKQNKRKLEAEESWPCDQCSSIFALKSSLRRHQREMHTGADIPCELCERTYPTRMRLNRHLKEYHKKDVLHH